MGRNQARIGRRTPVPTVWLLTDERIDTAALLKAAARLPRGAGIVLRHYHLTLEHRRALFDALARIARRRGLRLLLAGSVAQAVAWRADGAHGGNGERGLARRHRPPGFLRTVPAHDRREVRAAARAGADAAFLSPLFATRSHPGADCLGPGRFAALARDARLPVMALGGVHPRHARLVTRLGASGYGAIDGLVAGQARQNLKAVPI